MLIALAEWLRRHPVALVSLAWALLAAGMALTLKITLVQRDSARTQLARLTALGEQLQAQLDSQNLAVAAWQGAAEVQAKRVEATQDQAARVRVETQTRVQRVLVEKVPADCTQAVAWGRQQGATLVQSWEAGQ